MAQPLGTIYLMTFPNGKPYVGQTRRSLAERLQQHSARALGTKRTGGAGSALYSAIRKYGWPAIMELGRFPPDQLNHWERFFIEAMQSIAPHGYNITAGGDANPMLSTAGREAFNVAVRAPERIAKIRASSTGRKKPPLTQRQRTAISIRNSGRPSARRGAPYAAKQVGKKQYDGSPCKKCGGVLRWTSTGQCVPCTYARTKEQRRSGIWTVKRRPMTAAVCSKCGRTGHYKPTCPVD